MNGYYIYFILAEEVNRVKIGRTARHPFCRLSDLSRTCPVELTMLGAIRTYKDEETEWKFLLKEHCVKRGEGYDYNDRIKSIIKKRLAKAKEDGAFEAGDRDSFAVSNCSMAVVDNDIVPGVKTKKRKAGGFRS